MRIFIHSLLLLVSCWDLLSFFSFLSSGLQLPSLRSLRSSSLLSSSLVSCLPRLFPTPAWGGERTGGFGLSFTAMSISPSSRSSDRDDAMEKPPTRARSMGRAASSGPREIQQSIHCPGMKSGMRAGEAEAEAAAEAAADVEAEAEAAESGRVSLPGGCRDMR